MKSVFRWIVALIAIGTVALCGWRILRRSDFSSKLPPEASAASAQKAGAASTGDSTRSAGAVSKVAVMQSAATPPQSVGAELSLPGQIAALADSPNDADWNRVLNDLLPALFRQDRQAAARVWEKMAPGDRREQGLGRLSRLWAQADFAGAVDWIGSLASIDDRKTGFENACFGVVATNPAEAVHVWDTLGYGGDEQTLGNLVQAWATKDLSAAESWATAHGPSMQRDQAVARVGYVMADTKPTEAAAYVLREIPPGPAQTEAVISVLHRWAEHDQTGATAWVAGFPDEALRERAVGELAGITPARR